MRKAESLEKLVHCWIEKERSASVLLFALAGSRSELGWWEPGLEGGNYRSYKVIMFRKWYKSSTWSRAASMPGAAGWQSFLSDPMFTDLWLGWRAEAGPVTVNLNASDNCEDSSSWCLQTNKTSHSHQSRRTQQFYIERRDEALFWCLTRDLERLGPMLNC